MPVRIVKLIILFLLIAGVLYFVSLNSGPATVSMGPSNSVNGSIGIIVLTSFAVGVLLALLGASLYAARSYFREVGFKSREQKKIDLEQTLLQVNHDSRSLPFERARKRYQTLLSKYPAELSVVLDYARYLKSIKRYEDLKSLTSEGKKISAEFDKQVYLPELYFLSAEASAALGNQTGALDELALLMAKKKDPFAARWASKLSYELGRFEDCLEYLGYIHEQAPLLEEDLELKADAQASILIAETPNTEERITKLISFLMKQEKSKVAYRAIAQLQEQAGLKDESAQSLMRLFKITRDPEVIRQARALWINSGGSEKAVSAVKTWVRSSEGLHREEHGLAQLELAKTYLLIGSDESCRETLVLLEEHDRTTPLPADLKKDIVILKAMLAYRSKDSGASTIAFREVERIALEG